jgi:hypothetical protein
VGSGSDGRVVHAAWATKMRVGTSRRERVTRKVYPIHFVRTQWIGRALATPDAPRNPLTAVTGVAC